MKKKLTAKDINLILALVGVVVVVAVYLLVFQNFNTKNQELDAQIAEKQATYAELKECYHNLEDYQVGTEQSKKEIKNNLDRLPLGIASEDFLVYIMDSTSSVGASLTNVSFQDASELQSFSTVVDGSLVDVTGYEVGAGFNGTMTYAQLKEFLQIVYAEDSNITFIDSFSLTTNTEDAKLTVNFNLKKYYISYEGGEYIPVEMPYVSISTDNPFGSAE